MQTQQKRHHKLIKSASSVTSYSSEAIMFPQFSKKLLRFKLFLGKPFHKIVENLILSNANLLEKGCLYKNPLAFPINFDYGEMAGKIEQKGKIERLSKISRRNHTKCRGSHYFHHDEISTWHLRNQKLHVIKFWFLVFSSPGRVSKITPRVFELHIMKCLFFRVFWICNLCSQINQKPIFTEP